MNPMEPTPAPPGSTAKIEILERRAAAKLPLFHPADNKHAIRYQHGGTYWNFEHSEVVEAARAANLAKLAKARAERASGA